LAGRLPPFKSRLTWRRNLAFRASGNYNELLTGWATATNLMCAGWRNDGWHGTLAEVAAQRSVAIVLGLLKTPGEQ